MQIIDLDPAWDGLLDRRWLSDLDSSPFLARCRAGTVTSAELRSFVLQQHYYSRHFTRYLCALLGNLQNESDRFELAENLFEELGLGDVGSVPHAQMYRSMMRSLGVAAGEAPVLATTQRLIDTMLASCRSEDPLEGLGALCLGAEAIVPHVYSQILLGFAGVGTPPSLLEFFHIHVENDDAHAETMKRLIERELAARPEGRATLRHSAEQVIAARRSFFDALAEPATAFASPRRVVNDVIQL